MRRSIRRGVGAAPHARRYERGELLQTRELAERSAALRVQAGAAVLAAAVLADSAIEHYRGGFFRPAMYVAPVAAGMTCGAAIAGARNAAGRHRLHDAVYVLAAAVGAAGSWFHLTNLSNRGGWRWTNLFYGAPAAAPLGLHVAGLLGLCADRLRRPVNAQGWVQLRLISSSVAILSAIGLVGTSAEAWLFHFRGAFHNPFMHVPVMLPPMAAGALVAATTTRETAWVRAAEVLLQAAAVIGVAGIGFHAYGVHRRMGGWRNWTQNILSGPPLPAPPAFTGLALAGLAALRLMQTPRPSHGISDSLS